MERGQVIEISRKESELICLAHVGEQSDYAQLSCAVPYGVSCCHSSEAGFENSDMFHAKGSSLGLFLYLLKHGKYNWKSQPWHLISAEIKNY